MSGWKTYVFWLLSALVTVLFSQGIIGEKLYTFLIGLLVPAGAISQRLATKKIENKVDAAAADSSIAAAAATEAAASSDRAAKAVSK